MSAAATHEAAAWRLRMAEGPLTPAEDAALAAWLAADPRHPAAFDAAVCVWDAAGDEAQAPEMVVLRGAAIESARRAAATRWRRGVAPRLAAIAAVLVVAIFAAASLFGVPKVYRTGVGERELVVLSDGSRLSLDADTFVLARFSSHRRELSLLRGRARFAVAKDPLKPFAVKSGGRTVVALGTEFSVERLGGQVRVVLYEGKVSVLDRAAPVPVGAGRQPADAVLKPGSELVMADASPAKLASIDPVRSLSWEAGQLIFDDEPLASAIERVNRYSDEKLAVADSAAGRVLVSGVFTAGDTDAFVDGVAGVFPVRARSEDGQTVLSFDARR